MDSSEDDFRNVVSKFASHTVQNAKRQKKKKYSFQGENLKSSENSLVSTWIQMSGPPARNLVTIPVTLAILRKAAVMAVKNCSTNYSIGTAASTLRENNHSEI